METEQKNRNEKEAAVEFFWARMLALALLVLLVNLWSMHHSTDKLIGAVLSNGPFALLGIYGFFSGLANKEEKDSLAKLGRRVLLFFLKTPVLFVLYFLSVVLGATVSSVTVLADGERETASVRLAAEGASAGGEKAKKRLSGPDSVVTFLAMTTPFGSPYYVEVDGYVRESFDLYPFVGKKIRVRKDLSVSPSVLIRVPVGKHALVRVGAVRIRIDRGKEETVALEDGSASLLVGRRSGIPEPFYERWKLEMVALGIQGPVSARSILKWSDATFLKRTLKQGMVLEAQFLDANGKVHAEAKTTLSGDKISDVMLSILP